MMSLRFKDSVQELESHMNIFAAAYPLVIETRGRWHGLPAISAWHSSSGASQSRFRSRAGNLISAGPCPSSARQRRQQSAENRDGIAVRRPCGTRPSIRCLMGHRSVSVMRLLSRTKPRVRAEVFGTWHTGAMRLDEAAGAVWSSSAAGAAGFAAQSRCSGASGCRC